MRLPASLKRLLRNRKAVVATVSSVIALAVAISLFAAFAPSSDPKLPEVAPEAQSADLYTQALAADASGNTTTAVSLLKQAVVLDPGNTAAKKKIVQIEQRQAQSARPTTSAPSGTDPFLGTAPDLKKLLPKSLAGYSVGMAVVQGPEATVSGQPEDLTLGITKLVWAVHERKDAKTAAQFTSKVSKAFYGQDQASVQIDGASGYFGTNGTTFATVSYVRGRYVFEIVLSTDGAAPREFKAQAVAAAKAFPDTF